jgi:hypothetical protein
VTGSQVGVFSKEKEGKRMSTTQQTLVEITHPMFGKGYQEGRQRYFQGPYILADDALVDSLEIAFKECEYQQENEEERKKILYYEIGQLIGNISGCVIARQPYEDDMPDQQEEQLKSPTQQIPIRISDPMFRKGYQKGRQHYFQELYVLADDVLLDCLEFTFEPRADPREGEKEREERLSYEIGQLVGEICGCVLPRLPDEERLRDAQEALLAKVAQTYDETREALSKTIRQFWVAYDQLAHTLDADLFEEVITCCRLGSPVFAAET